MFERHHRKISGSLSALATALRDALTRKLVEIRVRIACTSLHCPPLTDLHLFDCKLYVQISFMHSLFVSADKCSLDIFMKHVFVHEFSVFLGSSKLIQSISTYLPTYIG